ncbi:MAG: EutN/CcmL family microcompartment protein [Anaerolineae bacterium]
MYIGRVIGTVVSTIKDKMYEGRKILVVEGLDLEGRPEGKYWLAVDVVQAGVGDRVLVLDEGNSARQILEEEPNGPVRAVVVGVVDEVEVKD